jgi:hypothetical protein
MRLRPENDRVQRRLAEFISVFEKTLELQFNARSAAFHFKNTPTRVLHHQSLFETVRNEGADRALRYLMRISGGQNG